MYRGILALGLVALILAPSAALAEERPIQLSLFNPIQIFPETDSVKGIRLNLIYGANQDVKGLDLGLVNRTLGDAKGIQWGLISLVDGDMTGWQDGFLAYTKGRFTGLQTAAITRVGTGEVFQWGIVNIADDASGFQLGLVNVAENFHGLQIGLVNVIKSKDKLPVFPIVNWKF